MFTRRTATVTISAPDASCAATMIWFVGYFPVPMIKRDLNVRSAMMKGCDIGSGFGVQGSGSGSRVRGSAFRFGTPTQKAPPPRPRS